MRRPRLWSPRPAVGAAIALSLALFGLLFARGWGDSAASIAGGLLLIACVAVCIWGEAQGWKAEREVDRDIGQIASAPRGQDRHTH
jgi:hypothetical protein